MLCQMERYYLVNAELTGLGIAVSFVFGVSWNAREADKAASQSGELHKSLAQLDRALPTARLGKEVAGSSSARGVLIFIL